MIQNDSKYYYDLKSNVVTKWFNAYGEHLVQKRPIDSIKWILSKENKMIGNYLCFKANFNYVVRNTKGEFNKKVTAWYAPKIPFYFGPKGFCNLPGLILELTDDKIIYVADVIKFSKTKENIPKLPKGKLISEDELKVLGDRARKNNRWSKKSN
jgi:GLPGLI family protein